MNEIEVTVVSRKGGDRDGARNGTTAHADVGTRWRAATSMGALVVRRRAWRDRGLLLVSMLLVVASTLLSVVAPRLVLDVVDRGAADVLERAGDRAQILLHASVGNSASETAGLRGELFEQFLEAAEDVGEHLPPTLARVAGETSSAVVTPVVRVSAIEVPIAESASGEGADGVVRVLEPVTWEGTRELQVFSLDVGVPAAGLLRVVEGTMPGPPGPRVNERNPLEIAVTAPVAEELGLELGSEIGLTSRASAAEWVRLVGIVEPVDPAAAVWTIAPETLEPRTRAARAESPAYARGTVVADAAAAAALVSALDQPAKGTIRIAVQPAAFDAATAAAASTELATVRSDPTSLTPALRFVTFSAEFDKLLASYPTTARAALAQMSVVAAGVVGVAAVVIGLFARLLVVRRSGQIALERARGSTVLAVAGRLLAESLVVAALGLGAGIALSQLFVAGLQGTALPLAAVGLAAVASAPVLGAMAARGAWTGRREPANRQDRVRLAKRRRVKRLVVELTVAALTAVGVLTLRGRGVLQTQTDGIDPFLAVVPLLLCLTVTLVVVRLFPYPVRAVGALTRRSRGPLGLLAAATASRSVAILPLLALTLGVGITTAGGLQVGTVNDGQEAAAWERVGADARIDAALTADELAALRTAEGVTHVATGIVAATTVDLGPVSDEFTVAAVERAFLDVLAQVPGVDPSSLEPAFVDAGEGEPVAMVVDPRIASRMSDEAVSLYFGPAFLSGRVVGTTTVSLAGYVDGPTIFVDLAQVDARMKEPRTRTTVWVTGPGADAAVEHVPDAAQLATTRTQWLEANRGSALVGGVQSMLVYAVVTVALLVAMALVATVLAGAHARGIVLSMLRTLGLRAGYGWWLAVSELAPVVLAALAGGIFAGTAILVLLGPTLGLVVLTGGVADPPLVIEPMFVLAVVAVAVVLLGVAVLAEVLTHRRDKLSEVLRVGATS